MDPYFHYKKMGHFITNCPSLQTTTSKNVHKEKKAMVAAWDNSKTDSKEKIDTLHVCFMANEEEKSKVNFKTSLEEDDLTMDELARFFEEL